MTVAFQRSRSFALFCTAAALGTPACRAQVEDPIAVSACNPTKILKASCGGSRACHDGSLVKKQSDLGSGLDLVTGDVAQRLLSCSGTSCSANRPSYIDVKNPDNSYFLQKLEVEVPVCGNPMPGASRDFTVDQLDCLKQWIESLAQNPPATGDAGVDCPTP